MAPEAIPDDVRDFVSRYIDTVAQLEALLLLRNNPNEKWDTRNVAQRLYVNERQASETLNGLRSAGLLVVENDQWRYACATAELEGVVDRLGALHSQHLIALTHVIHSKPSAARQFADAFKLRKDR